MSQTRHILVIENEDPYIEIIRRRIENAVDTLSIAKTLESARIRLQSEHYDLIITDLRLNDTDTSSLLQDLADIINTLRPRTPTAYPQPSVIVVTGKIATSAEISKAITDHPGWIWGWHHKDNLDAATFQRNVREALAIQPLENRLQVNNLAWSIALSVFLGSFLVALLLWSLIAWLDWDRIEPNLAVAGVLISGIGYSVRIIWQIWHGDEFSLQSLQRYLTKKN